MFPHLLLKQWIVYCIDKVIQCIDTRMNALEPLYLVSDCRDIGVDRRRLVERRRRRASAWIHASLVRLAIS